MSMIYATRSILPSRTANSVQSAHMAKAWERLVPGLSVVYRTERFEESVLDHFASYGIDPPREAKAIPVRFMDDLFHHYLLSFSRYLRRTTPSKLVYTRSSRMAWVAVRMGHCVVLELHDPLIPIRVSFLKKYTQSGRMPLLVATTERLKSDIVAQVGIEPEKVFVAGGGAAGSYVDVPANVASRHKSTSFHVGYAGSALRGKGVELVLACARKMPDVAFHLIGPSKKECVSLGELSSNVILHGYQTGPRVVALLKGMDGLLLPNKRSVFIRSGADIGQHTSPLKLFDYMSTGRPIIASDLPIFEGILKDSENSLLAAAEDIDAFCRAIRRLQREPVWGERLAENALRDFKNKYTWDHRVRNVADFIISQGIKID